MVDKAAHLYKADKKSKEAKTFAFEANDEGNVDWFNFHPSTSK